MIPRLIPASDNGERRRAYHEIAGSTEALCAAPYRSQYIRSMHRGSVAVIAVLVACAGRAEPARPDPRPAPPTAPEPAATPAPESKSLAEMIAEDMAPDHAWAWSARRLLVWSDFKGEPPGGGTEGARTAHAIHFAWICRSGGRFEFRATAAFLPHRSWVKPVVLRTPGESARVLRHEQAHFDISEVFTRRLRRRFAELPHPCDRRDGELNALAREVLEEEKAMQRRYDDETRHSLEIERQTVWETTVRRLLADLIRYAQ